MLHSSLYLIVSCKCLGFRWKDWQLNGCVKFKTVLNIYERATMRVANWTKLCCTLLLLQYCLPAWSLYKEILYNVSSFARTSPFSVLTSNPPHSHTHRTYILRKNEFDKKSGKQSLISIWFDKKCKIKLERGDIWNPKQKTLGW